MQANAALDEVGKKKEEKQAMLIELAVGGIARRHTCPSGSHGVVSDISMGSNALRSTCLGPNLSTTSLFFVLKTNLGHNLPSIRL